MNRSHFDELRFRMGQLLGSVNKILATKPLDTAALTGCDQELTSLIRQIEEVELARPDLAVEAHALIDRAQRILKPVREGMLSDLP